MKTIILITLLALFSFSVQTLKKGRGNGGYLFYSIDINDEGKLFKEIIIPALSEINQNYFSDVLDDILNSLSTNKQGDFKIPNNLHITTYYKGRNPFDNENKVVKEFKLELKE